jgi:hypothetical protein
MTATLLLTVSMSQILLREGNCKVVSLQAMKAYEEMEAALRSF